MIKLIIIFRFYAVNEIAGIVINYYPPIDVSREDGRGGVVGTVTNGETTDPGHNHSWYGNTCS